MPPTSVVLGQLANSAATSREIEQKRPLVGGFEVERPVVSTREANKASWFDGLARRYLRYRQSDWGKMMTDWARAGQYWNDRMHGIRPTRPPPIPSDRVEGVFPRSGEPEGQSAPERLATEGDRRLTGASSMTVTASSTSRRTRRP